MTSRERGTVAVEQPNIVFIMADDMGYGDVGCYNSDSKIPTPNMNRLAREGTVVLLTITVDEVLQAGTQPT